MTSPTSTSRSGVTQPTPRPSRYVCAQCGQPGVPDDYTAIDARFTTGRCTGDHRGFQYLVREDVYLSDPKKKEKKK